MIGISPAKVLGVWLANQGIAIDQLAMRVRDPLSANKWAIYEPSLPDQGDNILMLRNTAGLLDGRYMRGGLVVYHPGISIIIRAGQDRYEDGWNFGASLANALSALYNAVVPLNGKNYQIQSVTITTPPISLGEEKGTRRQLYSMNVRITISEIT
jgi:hypothetical protein